MMARVILMIFSFWICQVVAEKPVQPIPVDQAFSVSAKLFGMDTLVVTWKITPGYYLYRDRIHFSVEPPSSLGQLIFPQGIFKEDNILGKYQVYADGVTISVPIIQPDLDNTRLKVSYQGCAQDGYCYPPTTKNIQAHFTQGMVNVVAETAAESPPSVSLPVLTAHVKIDSVQNEQQQPFIQALKNQSLLAMALTFLGFGILLAFTPCVLPMLPILSGIILGHKEHLTTGKAFRLSVVYVLSMAVTYAVAGVLVGTLGGSIQSAFQKPWIIVLFSLFFVALALSFFGFYQIRMPARLEEKLSSLSRQQKGGSYWGVAIMGCLATLIVSPCVTPALVGVLSYIAREGNPWLGGIALLMLGIGMGLPLLIVGTTGGKLLPKAGRWMQTLEQCFGVLFLGLAIWMLDRILPGSLTMLLWSALLIISAIYLGAFAPYSHQGWHKLWKGLGLITFSYGILMLVGVAQGSINPLKPLEFLNYSREVNASDVSNKMTDPFTRIQSDQVQSMLAQAALEHRPVVLDFYADWCVSCKEMEQTTFKEPKVIHALKNTRALQVDVTAHDVRDKNLMQTFQVIAPPTLLFFNAEGQWLSDLTLVGKVEADKLIDKIHTLMTFQDVKI